MELLQRPVGETVTISSALNELGSPLNPDEWAKGCAALSVPLREAATCLRPC